MAITDPGAFAEEARRVLAQLGARDTITPVDCGMGEAFVGQVGSLAMPDGFLDAQRSLNRGVAVGLAGWGQEPAFFGRFEFEDDAPAIIAAAQAMTDQQVAAELDILEQQRDAEYSEWWDDTIDIELTATARAAGDAPDRADIPPAITTASALDRWLADWEDQRGAATPEAGADTFVFDPDASTWLGILPIDQPWQVLAVEHWCESHLPLSAALLARWEIRFDARLVAHWGTMLQIATGRLPDAAEAVELARAHDLLSNSLLAPAGIPRRHLARWLTVQPVWFLHSRP